MGRAIKERNHKFLAYLLVYTRNQGDEAIGILKDRYEEERGFSLDFDLNGSWEDLFSVEVPRYYEGQFQRVEDR